MTAYFFVFLALGIGYVIPVLTALLVSMAAGSFVPRLVARRHKIQQSYLVVYALVWTVSVTAAAFLAAWISGLLQLAVCCGLAILLLLTIWSNFSDMKQRPSSLQLIGMSLGTVVGIVLGYRFFLLTL